MQSLCNWSVSEIVVNENRAQDRIKWMQLSLAKCTIVTRYLFEFLTHEYAILNFMIIACTTPPFFFSCYRCLSLHHTPLMKGPVVFLLLLLSVFYINIIFKYRVSSTRTERESKSLPLALDTICYHHCSLTPPHSEYAFILFDMMYNTGGSFVVLSPSLMQLMMKASVQGICEKTQPLETIQSMMKYT